MARNEERYRTWLEFIGDTLQQPIGVSSQYEGRLLELLAESFNGACSMRNRVVSKWDSQIVDCSPRDYIPGEPPAGFTHRQQPLLRWYVFTGQSEPQSLGRVPNALAGSRLKWLWQEVARPWGLNHQLSIPLQVGGDAFHAYQVFRPDRDFTDQELALAKLLQPILTGLNLNFGIAAPNGEANLDGSAQDLTAREMSVLSLLTEGLTAEALSRRLGISPRTAGKHLEHIYRKLDVGDRLMAVKRAQELGLMTASAGNAHIGQSSGAHF